MLTWRPRTKTTRIIVASSNTPPDTPSVSRLLTLEGRMKGLLETGYHFVIERTGAAVACRPHDVMGSHTRLANHDSVAICLGGGWQGRDDHTQEQHITLHRLVRDLRRAYGQHVLLVGQNEVYRKPGSARSPALDMAKVREANPPLLYTHKMEDPDMAKKPASKTTKPVAPDGQPDSKGAPVSLEAATIGALTPQQGLVVNYLRAGHTLTPLIALTNLGIGSITSRVAELKKAGYPIEATPDQDFHGGRYMKYTWGLDQYGNKLPLPAPKAE